MSDLRFVNRSLIFSTSKISNKEMLFGLNLGMKIFLVSSTSTVDTLYIYITENEEFLFC